MTTLQGIITNPPSVCYDDSHKSHSLSDSPLLIDQHCSSGSGIIPVAPTLRILIVEDSASDARVLIRSLRNGLATPFEFDQVDHLATALAVLQRSKSSKTGGIGLIITDLNLPDSSGLDTFRKLAQQAGEIPIVILSGQEGVELALASVRLGAQDYVVKGESTPESLGRIVRFAIERSRRLEAERDRDHATRELEIAHRIQHTLYPAVGASLPGFDIAGAVYSAAKACGDYYDFLSIPGDRFGIAVGDVCGHGLPAALMMLQVRTCLRLLAKQGASPAAVLTGVNEAVLHEDPDQRRFTSLFFARLDPHTRELEFASGGHRGYVLTANGSIQKLDSTVPVVGILPDIGVPEVTTLTLHPGDILFVPTDGFHEARNSSREPFGESQMLNTIYELRARPADDIIHQLHTQTRAFTGAVPQQDDMAAIVVKVN